MTKGQVSTNQLQDQIKRPLKTKPKPSKPGKMAAAMKALSC